jgi:hypothetical protein
MGFIEDCEGAINNPDNSGHYYSNFEEFFQANRPSVKKLYDCLTLKLYFGRFIGERYSGVEIYLDSYTEIYTKRDAKCKETMKAVRKEVEEDLDVLYRLVFNNNVFKFRLCEFKSIKDGKIYFEFSQPVASLIRNGGVNGQDN